MAARRVRGCVGFIIAVILILVIVAAVGLWFVHSGIYNVAATYRDRPQVAWLFSTTMDNSVKRHAAGIRVPPLDYPAMVDAAASHYRAMCVECHGAPGVQIGATGRGLNPGPPMLTDAANDWSPAELFWITKNGIRMSGMPAWGATHSDQKIWELVAFMKKLPSMKPAQYEALVAKASPVKQR